MIPSPTAHQIISIAALLGFSLDADEVPLYQVALTEQLAELDQFAQARLAEDRPLLLFPERAPAYRPLPGDDPYRAWLWRCRIGGRADGLLAGKTVGVKDHVSVAGIPQCFASYPLENFVPDLDATVVTRVLEGGGQVIGKQAMTGFLGDYGPTLNPHDPTRIAGGSSSGSAVAVAVGDVDVSFGGDQGGSIRIPAAYCGVLGLKPSFGLVSHFGVGFGAEQSIDHVGPMARRVEDLAAALEVVAGYDLHDPRQARDVPDTFPVVTGLDRGVRGVRVGLLEEGFAGPADETVIAGVRQAAEVLAQAGATVTTVSVPQHRQVDAAYAALSLEGARALFDTGFFGTGAATYYPASVIAAVHGLWHDHADMLVPRTKVNLIAAELSRRAYGGAVYAKAHNVRSGYVRAYDEALSAVDVLLMPTVRTVAPVTEPEPRDRRARLAARLGRNWLTAPSGDNTRPFNYTGHPALAVPCGRDGALPFSMQLVGRRLADPLLLRVAYTYQHSVDWPGLTAIAGGSG
jgi:amidase